MSKNVPLFDEDLYIERKERLIKKRREDLFLARHAHGIIEDSLENIRRQFDKGLYLDTFEAALPLSNTENIEYTPIRESFSLLKADKKTPDKKKYNLVIANMIFHALNDPLAALRQIKNSLEPDGFFIAVFPGGESLHQLRTVLREAEGILNDSISPRTIPMIDVKDAGALLQKAGFALPVADAEKVTFTYPNINKMIADLRAAGETNIMFARSRKFLPLDFWSLCEKIYRERYAQNERLPLQIDFITLSGWAPHESQQQARKPGSAEKFLGDYL